MRDHNPNDAFRAKLEDPLTLMRAREALREGSRRLELKAPMTAAGVTDARGGPGRGQSADGVRSGRRRRCARGDGGRGGDRGGRGRRRPGLVAEGREKEAREGVSGT